MDETMPDAAPLSQRFLASLASFMENEHELLGEGDISSKVKGAIAESETASGSAPNAAEKSTNANHNSSSTTS